MDDSKQEFLNSLDLIDQEVEAYIPVILEDLWELGSMPEYIIQLIKENVNPLNIHKITDFGCGKGAVLIKLALEFAFDGVGVDIVPEFIASAQKYAVENHVSNRIKFKIGDLKDIISNTQDNDLVIYGYDSGILGSVKASLLQLKKCISEQGWIILEVAYTPDAKDQLEGLPSERELYRQIEESGLQMMGKILWDQREIRKVNHRNNHLIQSKIKELTAVHPDKAQLFQRYMDNQLEECRQIENDMICSTWLFRK